MHVGKYALHQVDVLGARAIYVLKYTVNVLGMVYLSIRAAVYDQAQGLRSVISVVSAQIYFTGWQALPIISVLALASGTLVILQSSSQLSLLGGGNMTGTLMVAVVIRELGPLLTALIVIARSGTAVASEIGMMKVNRETDALQVMGINPLSYIVFPRLVGGLVSVLCLAFYFNVVAIVGGYFVTRLLQDMPLHFYMASISNAVQIEDVGLFFLKNGFSGIIIFVVSCYQGMLVKLSPHEVPQATMKAVVNSIVYVVGFNLVVTILFYLSKLKSLGLV